MSKVLCRNSNEIKIQGNLDKVLAGSNLSRSSRAFQDSQTTISFKRKFRFANFYPRFGGPIRKSPVGSNARQVNNTQTGTETKNEFSSNLECPSIEISPMSNF